MYSVITDDTHPVDVYLLKNHKIVCVNHKHYKEELL